MYRTKIQETKFDLVYIPLLVQSSGRSERVGAR